MPQSCSRDIRCESSTVVCSRHGGRRPLFHQQDPPRRFGSDHQGGDVYRGRSEGRRCRVCCHRNGEWHAGRQEGQLRSATFCHDDGEWPRHDGEDHSRLRHRGTEGHLRHIHHHHCGRKAQLRSGVRAAITIPRKSSPRSTVRSLAIIGTAIRPASCCRRPAGHL